MSKNITVLSFRLPFRLGDVNCYLIQAGAGFVLIDTGPSSRRAELEAALAAAGCTPGTLLLIVLTHGDFDHTGNAAYLKQTYGAPLAMHAGDLEMLTRGNMFANRKRSPLVRLLGPLLRALSGLLMGFGRAERCTPSLTLDEGDDLADYGLDARVLVLGGHSTGSLGVLAEEGAFFCGDLLINREQPALNDLMPDPETAQASLSRLQATSIEILYPGHGAPFAADQLANLAATS
jgi:glyoxylase-like metal-dependent hydrolase (beta-lactamase superfamily II)